MSFDDFIDKWDLKGVDFDGIYPNQCMDLMHQYVYEVLGLTDKTILAAPAAYQVFTNFSWGQYFDKIVNSPTGVPQKGDIVLFGTAIGAYGHVCIFIEGDANQFTSFDANWPTGSLCHKQSHNYNGVLGWLHPKASSVSNSPQPQQLVFTDQTKIPASLLGTSEDLEIQAIRGKLKDLASKTTDLENCQKELSTLQQQVLKLMSDLGDSEAELKVVNQQFSDYKTLHPVAISSPLDAPKTPDIVWKYDLANYHFVITKT
jgi:hypothetical protein